MLPTPGPGHCCAEAREKMFLYNMWTILVWQCWSHRAEECLTHHFFSSVEMEAEKNWVFLEQWEVATQTCFLSSLPSPATQGIVREGDGAFWHTGRALTSWLPKGKWPCKSEDRPWGDTSLVASVEVGQHLIWNYLTDWRDCCQQSWKAVLLKHCNKRQVEDAFMVASWKQVEDKVMNLCPQEMVPGTSLCQVNRMWSWALKW